MAEVSVSEARNNLSRLIKQPQDGQEIVITSHGRPVARLVPIRPVMSGAELVSWLRDHQVRPELARTRAEVDADIAAERDSW